MLITSLQSVAGIMEEDIINTEFMLLFLLYDNNDQRLLCCLILVCQWILWDIYKLFYEMDQPPRADEGVFFSWPLCERRNIINIVTVACFQLHVQTSFNGLELANKLQ